MLQSLMLPDPPGGLLALTPPSGETSSSPFAALVPILFMVGVFYFILFRPMRKRQKNLQQMISNLKRGDKVVTTGGLMGTVMGISERVIQLKIADGVTIDVSRNAIAGLQHSEGETNGS